MGDKSLFDCSTAQAVSLGLIIVGIPVSIILLFIPAWYGRYGNQKRMYLGSLPAKVAWIFQECPSFLIPFIYLMMNVSVVKDHWVNIVCLAFFLFHYFYRAFIYPFRIQNGKNTPTELFLLAVLFCILNGYDQAVYQITPCQVHTVSWLYDPRFIIGVILFISGLSINWHSDAILRSLRADGSSGYKIPHGGMFEYVSGANYFGECIEWIGYACLCWNLGALAFSVFTIANIGPRALQHHKWYKKTFGDEYPSSRKALIPYILSYVCNKT